MSLQRTQSPIADTELAIGETYRPKGKAEKCQPDTAVGSCDSLSQGNDIVSPEVASLVGEPQS